MLPKLIPDTYFTTSILIWLPFSATRFSNHQGTVLRGLSAEVVTVTREPGWKSRKATPLGKQRGRKRWKHLYTAIILGHGYVSFPGCTHGNRIKPSFGEFPYYLVGKKSCTCWGDVFEPMPLGIFMYLLSISTCARVRGVLPKEFLTL